jgi:DNA-binding PadR family transcriptional regulator
VGELRPRLRDFILLYLASKGSKCATLHEILDAMKQHNYSYKNPMVMAAKTLSSLKKQGLIRRSWVSVPQGLKYKKVRLYCLRSSMT